MAAAAESPLYERLAHDLGASIAKGQLRAGDRLPSEDELADRFKVSKITVRQALRELAQLGHIPVEGEVLHYQGWTFTVTEVERHRVEQVRVRPPADRQLTGELFVGEGQAHLAPDDRSAGSRSAGSPQHRSAGSPGDGGGASR